MRITMTERYRQSWLCCCWWWLCLVVCYAAGSPPPNGVAVVRGRQGWLRIQSLWMDVEKSCFPLPCSAPYTVQMILIEPTINHSANFVMDIENPVLPVDMYFPLPVDQTAAVDGNKRPPGSSVQANFSVGLLGIDPSYNFARHCHSMIEQTSTLELDAPSTLILSFSAKCLNLTFQMVIVPSAIDWPTGRDADADADRSNDERLASVDSTGRPDWRTSVPTWLAAALAVTDAALLICVLTLAWRSASGAKKRRQKLKRQRSASTTASSYAPSSTTPINRRSTPPLPPPRNANEPKYDVPWADVTQDNLACKAQFLNYYFSPSMQHQQHQQQLQHHQAAVVSAQEVCERAQQLRSLRR